MQIRAVWLVAGAAVIATPATGQSQATADEGSAAWYADIEALSSGVHAIEKDSSYAVAGLTSEDLRVAMDERAPIVDNRRVQGAHFWEWRHHYEYLAVEGGLCEVTKSVVLVRSLIVLPRWTDAQAADRSLAREWAGYRFRLREHEDGHRQITLRSATDLWERVQARPPSSCAGLRGQMRALADSVFDESADQHEAYDSATAHGLTQGARWPPGDD